MGHFDEASLLVHALYPVVASVCLVVAFWWRSEHN